MGRQSGFYDMAPRGKAPAPADNARMAGEGDHAGLAAANLRLALRFVERRYGGPGRNRDFEDDFQAAALGLLEAAKRWDPARGVRFSTYANAWMQQQTAHRREREGTVVRRPRHAIALLSRWLRAGGRDDPDGAFRAMGVDPGGPKAAMVRLAFRAGLTGGLGYAAESPATAATSRGADLRRRDPLEAAAEAEEAARLAAARRRLNDREEAVVRVLYDEGGTLKDAGAAIGRTRQRAQQVEGSALERLRAELGAA